MLLPPLSPSPQSGDGDKGGGKTDIRVPFPDTDLSNAKHRRKTAPHCGVRERQSGYATPTWALPMPVHRIHRVIHTPAAFSVKNRRADTGDLPRFMTHSIYLSTFPPTYPHCGQIMRTARRRFRRNRRHRKAVSGPLRKYPCSLCGAFRRLSAGLRRGIALDIRGRFRENVPALLPEAPAAPKTAAAAKW